MIGPSGLLVFNGVSDHESGVWFELMLFDEGGQHLRLASEGWRASIASEGLVKERTEAKLVKDEVGGNARFIGDDEEA